jgi:hypothetical protein
MDIGCVVAQSEPQKRVFAVEVAVKIYRLWFYLITVLLIFSTSVAQVPSQIIQGDAVETFLKQGQIKRAKDIPLGVTLPKKLTLELRGESHNAAFKSIDESAPLKVFGDGTREANFQDSYRTEIAAYEVDKLIGLGMVPATVERTFDGKRGSAQFWVDSIMDETTRLEKKIEPPDVVRWNNMWAKSQVWDNLIYNVDRNRGNMLITKDWEIILIDHSRSFRPWEKLKNPADLTRFSKSLLEGLSQLNEQNLKEKTEKYLSKDQRKAVLKRRDLILDLAKQLAAQRGEAAVLYP